MWERGMTCFGKAADKPALQSRMFPYVPPVLRRSDTALRSYEWHPARIRGPDNGGRFTGRLSGFRIDLLAAPSRQGQWRFAVFVPGHSNGWLAMEFHHLSYYQRHLRDDGAAPENIFGVNTRLPGGLSMAR
jgi:hypothetical protein